jgi:DNA-binding GntR family transcriptional regulator
VNAPTYRQLERESLRDQARQAIRTSVITGELEPGPLYTIGAFASLLGVSATPVREALGDLANDGLVQIIRNRGFVVPPVSEHDLDEIFELRLMLEVPAVARSAGRLDDGGRAACRHNVEAGTKAAQAGDLVAFLEYDAAFHRELLLPLGNARLVEIVARLRDQTRLYGLPDLAVQGLLTVSAQEHESLLEAVEAGDAERAQAEMTRHLKHTRGSWAGRSEQAG